MSGIEAVRRLHRRTELRAEIEQLEHTLRIYNWSPPQWANVVTRARLNEVRHELSRIEPN